MTFVDIGLLIVLVVLVVSLVDSIKEFYVCKHKEYRFHMNDFHVYMWYTVLKIFLVTMMLVLSIGESF